MSQLNFFRNNTKARSIDVERYLNRIGIPKENPSLAYLRKLHKAHLMCIPFENLDLHYGTKVILDYKKIFDKIILRKRGGYWYELNGLFYHLLYHLGFNCHVASAQIKNDKSQRFGRDFDHMVVIVQIEKEQYLVDVGLGASMMYPKIISKATIQMDFTDYWRFTTDPDENLILQQSYDSASFKSVYLFTLQKRELIQFMEMNEHHQSNKDYILLRQKLITKVTETGKIKLTEKLLTIQHLGNTEESEIANEDAFLSKLDQHFGIQLKDLIRL